MKLGPDFSKISQHKVKIYQETMAGAVIQATGAVKFEDG